jgi:hypothetical protein
VLKTGLLRDDDRVLSFDNQRSIMVRAETGTIILRRGFAVHRLEIHAELRTHGLDTAVICELQGDLSTAGHESRWLSTAAPVRLALSDATNCSLKFPLTNEQLLALEEHRAGGPLRLQLSVNAFLPTLSSDPERPQLVQADTQEHLQIPASVWNDALEGLDAAVTFTLTLALPSADGVHREAAEYLREARRMLNAGEYDNAIGAARKAMERVEAISRWPAISKNDDLRQRSQEQRWKAIYKAAFDQASGAEHADEVTKDFVYTRRETEAVIGIAASLLKSVPGPT